MNGKKELTPQEQITALRYQFCPPKHTKEENKALCEKYPFLRWYGDPLYVGYSEEKINYDYTWEDDIPDGWRAAFCPQMWDELKTILEKADYVDQFRFVQIKEKWGQLRIYEGGLPSSIADEVYEWESKYERLSEKYCIHCGKPVKYMTLGWISFVCPECAEARQKENKEKGYGKERMIPIEDIEEYYKDYKAYCEKHPIEDDDDEDEEN